MLSLRQNRPQFSPVGVLDSLGQEAPPGLHEEGSAHVPKSTPLPVWGCAALDPGAPEHLLLVMNLAADTW